jgi:catechol 2,3-dioxygenase-like lactoylglutathione lyase family enzyme
MTVMRVERVVYGVTDVAECTRFFEDFGLERIGETASFGTQTGQVLELRPADDPSLPPAVEEGSTLREVVWGVDTEESLEELANRLATDREVTRHNHEAHTVDETGFGLGLAVSKPKTYQCGEYPDWNRTGDVKRWNQPLDHPGRVRPIRLIHVAVNIPKAGKEEAVALYTDRLGFKPSERVKEVGQFLRAEGDTDHHTLLLGHRADRAGMNHTAWEVATVDEVIVGANDMIDKGWHESRYLGRHTVGSNYFRFIHAPCGGRVEFASDMDRVDDSYGPRDHEVTPPHTIFALKRDRTSNDLSGRQAVRRRGVDRGQGRSWRRRSEPGHRRGHRPGAVRRARGR